MKALCAVGPENQIGMNGKLIYHSSEDMKLFKSKTMNGIVIMGRKTFESMNETPLKDRFNIVLSTTKKEYQIPNVLVVESVDECCKFIIDARSRGLTYMGFDLWNVNVIGGAMIYDQFTPLITQFLVSEFSDNIPGDTFINLNNFTDISITRQIGFMLHEKIQYYCNYDIEFDTEFHRKYNSVIENIKFGVFNVNYFYDMVKTFVSKVTDGTVITSIKCCYSLSCYESQILFEDYAYVTIQEYIQYFKMRYNIITLQEKEEISDLENIMNSLDSVLDTYKKSFIKKEVSL